MKILETDRLVLRLAGKPGLHFQRPLQMTPDDELNLFALELAGDEEKGH